jgi:soluble lytic murein transglycosylase
VVGRLKILAAMFLVVALSIWFAYNSISFQRLLYPYHHRSIIEKYAAERGIDPLLVVSIIRQESKFSPVAVSRRGARGLMQLMPGTAVWMADLEGISDFHSDMLYDPEINIRLGIRYIFSLMGEFGNDEVIILAAYNAGRGNVKQWLTKEEWSPDGKTLVDVPFRETKEYIQRVLNNYYHYRRLYF